MYSAEDVRQVIAFMLDKITAAKGTLQKSLDRAWEDEDLNTTAVIAANAIAWRDQRIKDLERDLALLVSMRPPFQIFSINQEVAELNARVDKCLANLEDLKSEREKLVKSYAENIDRLVAYFTRRQRENHKRAEKEEEQVKQLYNAGCKVTAKDRENSSYYFSGKASSYENAALKVREFLG